MAKPLSPDLRIRIIRAVEDEGMSCRGAAARFGVALSTAIELVSESRSTGTCEARMQGGDRRSARIESYAAEILALVVATPDITLAELAERLFKAHGERFAPSVTAATSRSKKRCTPASRIGPRWPLNAWRGRHLSPRLTSTGWCSSMRGGPRPKWRGSMAAALRGVPVTWSNGQ
jgi:transposase